jgi:type I restriction enzyme S subunit
MISFNLYEHYKDSDNEWIGEIPSHWEVLPYYSIGIQSKLIENNDSKRVLSLSYGNIVVKSTESNKGLLPDNYDSYQTVEKGDIILRLTDLQNDKKSLRVGISKFSGIITSVYLNLRVTNSVISNQYLFRYLYSCDILKIFYFMGGGVRQSLTYTDFRKFPIPLPPLSEQEQIVSYLDEKTSLIDEMVEKKKRKIELLKEYRTSLINTVVTKGLNPDVPMKDSGIEWIGEIPSHWVVSKVKYTSKVFGRIGYRGYTVEDLVDENEGCITISPGNIYEDVFNLNNVTYLSWEKYHESPEIMIFEGDIIIVKTGSTIGKTCIIPSNVPEMTINPQLIVLKNIQLNNKYMYYLTTCKYFKKLFSTEQTGGTTPTISQEKINDFCVLIPQKIEQEQIVSYLDEKTSEIDKTIELENKKIELLKEYRQSLISNVVTGKIKVVSE